jgi:phosphatidylinositol glycan class A protein
MCRKEMYSWADVAERTERVYHRVVAGSNLPLAQRLLKYNGCGVIAGKLAIMIMAVDYLLLLLLEWLFPRSGIDISPTFDVHLFHEHCRTQLPKHEKRSKKRATYLHL